MSSLSWNPTIIARYHAKGLWYAPEGGSPSITLIGSSNLGVRSAQRDLEAQLLILTENESLRKRMDEVRTTLFQLLLSVAARSHASGEKLPVLAQALDRHGGSL
jgi:CDP-diacylglycerol--glycerol-3-phosphate 3-phosphatidyltransferase